MTKFQKVGHIICSYALVPAGIAMVLWVCIVVAYIISRLFGAGWQFVEEGTGYWLVFLAYIPLGYGVLAHVHVRADIVTRRLSEKARNLLGCCTDGLSLVIASYLLYRSFEWLIAGVKMDAHSATGSAVLLWPIYLIIPIGLVVFILALAITFANSVAGLRVRK